MLPSATKMRSMAFPLSNRESSVYLRRKDHIHNRLAKDHNENSIAGQADHVHLGSNRSCERLQSVLNTKKMIASIC